MERRPPHDTSLVAALANDMARFELDFTLNVANSLFVHNELLGKVHTQNMRFVFLVLVDLTYEATTSFI